MIANVKEITYDEAKKHVPECSYALMYKYSEIKFCKTEDIKEEDWQECTEARVFDREKEFHFWMDDGIRVILVEDTAEDACIEKAYELRGPYRMSPDSRKLIVKQYLEADEDGQMQIVLTRLVDVE